ncbi:hypothetical protein GUITHDRAFT_121085 [Guillardia theta CCMP2712]|uniref:PH domain-containing protein n=2 Tax=Guillardia theta TaxID=55529 RepID=L1I8Y6_GUITC|nr:hypothetical protein GUITHDRAFT_121085 [Guillardia theta CCMP2712]EKX32731.1 hypothetical protein GUITHDRAFT_121085 [Guillardia theta CCMP2712]|eukprot:XP_005819711.1 hypothetical protein GUITHDRAFT_121085 [Guillardia theta CCMP2712]
MQLFGSGGESRELLKRHHNDAGPALTLTQVGLGQSRGYLLVREMPDGSGMRRWCVLKEDRLWLFESPDSPKPGQSIHLEEAVVSDGARWRNTEQSNSFQVRTASGRHYIMQAKSSGDANMWIRAMRQHTAKETPNQIMDKAERAIQKAELANALRLSQHASRVRRKDAIKAERPDVKATTDE